MLSLTYYVPMGKTFNLICISGFLFFSFFLINHSKIIKYALIHKLKTALCDVSNKMKDIKVL